MCARAYTHARAALDVSSVTDSTSSTLKASLCTIPQAASSANSLATYGGASWNLNVATSSRIVKTEATSTIATIPVSIERFLWLRLQKTSLPWKKIDGKRNLSRASLSTVGRAKRTVRVTVGRREERKLQYRRCLRSIRSEGIFDRLYLGGTRIEQSCKLVLGGGGKIGKSEKINLGESLLKSLLRFASCLSFGASKDSHGDLFSPLLIKIGSGGGRCGTTSESTTSKQDVPTEYSKTRELFPCSYFTSTTRSRASPFLSSVLSLVSSRQQRGKEYGCRPICQSRSIALTRPALPRSERRSIRFLLWTMKRGTFSYFFLFSSRSD